MERESSSRKGNVYQRITDEIIKAIESGAGEFRMPWHRSGDGNGLPMNALTGRSYQGVNVLALWVRAMNRGYSSPYWASYRQWCRLGAQVQKGEKGSAIVFYKEDVGSEEEGAEDEQPGRRYIMRSTYVFNALQVDGWKTAEASIEADTFVERIADAESLVTGIGARIIHGGDRAFYNLVADHICIPECSRFTGTDTSTATEAYYSTLFHEHIHWSGHPTRLNRTLAVQFGSEAYAMEELIAELGAAFLCADAGISVHPRQDHAAYVESWLKALRERHAALASATFGATVACRYLWDLAHVERGSVVSMSA